jgi:TrmH family RNA methyltransferase
MPAEHGLRIRITSPANPRIKAVVRLRSRHDRERSGLTLIDGGRELSRALDAGVRVREAFVCPPLLRLGDAAAAVERLDRQAADVIEVTPEVFEKVAFGGRTEGVVAVVEVPATALAGIQLPAEPLIVVAERVEKPGNLGAIVRSADGAGADVVVAASPRTDPFNPSAIRASLGTIFAVPLAVAESVEVLAWLRDQKVRIVAARPGADQLATDMDLTEGLALVVGTEAEGLGATWDAPDVVGARIPMLGAGDSLNVAAATAVLLYEARRQRGLPVQHRAPS